MSNDSQEISRLVRETQQAARDAHVDNIKILSQVVGLNTHVKKSLENIIKNAEYNKDIKKYEQDLKQIIKGEGEIQQLRRKALLDQFRDEEELIKLKKKQELDLHTAALAANDLLNQRRLADVEATNKQALLRTAQSALNTAALIGPPTQDLIDAVAEAAEAERQAIQKADRLDIQFHETSDAARALSDSLDEFDKTLETLRTSRQDNERRYANRQYQAQEIVANGMKKYSQQLMATIASLVSFNQAVKLVYGGTKAQIATGIGINQFDVNRLSGSGMSAGDFAEYSKENRRVILAQGGTDRGVEQLLRSAELFSDTIPDLVERNKMVTLSFNNMINAGIVPTATNMKSLAGTYKDVQKLTSLTSEQYAAYMTDMQEANYYENKLRLATTDKERIAIQNSITARLLENTALGKSTELIAKQQKAISQETGGPAIERLKKSLIFAQMMSSMGMGGDKADFMRRMIAKGTYRMTEPERSRYATIRDEVAANRRNALSSGSGITGQELTANIFESKLPGMNLESNDMWDKNIVKPSENAAQALGEVSDTSKTLVKYFEQLSSIIKNNPYIQAGGAAVATVGSGLLQGAGAAGMFKMLGGMGAGAGAGGAGGGAIASLAAALIPLVIGAAVAGVGVWGINKAEEISISNFNKYDRNKTLTPQEMADFKQKYVKNGPNSNQSASGGGGGLGQMNTTSIKEQETLDPSIKYNKANADRLQKIADNSDFLPRILDVAEKTLAVNISAAENSSKSKLVKMIKSGSTSASWNNALIKGDL